MPGLWQGNSRGKSCLSRNVEVYGRDHYDGVNKCTPENLPLSFTRNGIENGTIITNTSTFSLVDERHRAQCDAPQLLPNARRRTTGSGIAEAGWRRRGGGDPIIDVWNGLVTAHASYQLGTKTTVKAEGVCNTILDG